MKRLLLAGFLLLAACDYVPAPRPWNNILDSYMAARGWTLNDTRETISKKGVALWYYDSNCFRYCSIDNYLGPGELQTTLATEFFKDLKIAQNAYLADFASTVDVAVPEAESK